jgi:DNA-binding transcriptional MerR regulator
MEYTTKELASICGISVRTILYWLKDNKINAPQKFRDQYVWTDNDLMRLNEYIKENKGKRRKTGA